METAEVYIIMMVSRIEARSYNVEVCILKFLCQ